MTTIDLKEAVWLDDDNSSKTWFSNYFTKNKLEEVLEFVSEIGAELADAESALESVESRGTTKEIKAAQKQYDQDADEVYGKFDTFIKNYIRQEDSFKPTVTIDGLSKGGILVFDWQTTADKTAFMLKYA